MELYRAIQKLRPAWHHDDDDKGTMDIVMSGSASDTLEWQQHIRSKARREELANAFNNPKKPFRIVVARDMAAAIRPQIRARPPGSEGAGTAISKVFAPILDVALRKASS
ncbi:MAG: hypothetical protein KJ072_10980 [Verrucomicrobia bacterium]|nr:hypothetical protein [Verrucomicrobiota bacterium]